MIQKRNIGLSIILSIVTCGIYGIYWFITITEDVKKVSHDESLPSGGVAFLLTLVTCGIYGFYWAYRMGKALQSAQTQAGFTAASDNSVLYIILMICGLGIVNYCLMQNTLNTIADKGDGATGTTGAAPQQPTATDNSQTQATEATVVEEK